MQFVEPWQYQYLRFQASDKSESRFVASINKRLRQLKSESLPIQQSTQEFYKCLFLFGLLHPNKTIMARLKLTALSSLQVSSYQIPSFHLIPNTSIQYRPLMIYHSCLPPSATASSIESRLSDVDIVVPKWRYSMYKTTQLHSTTHEVLYIASGHAKICTY